MLQGEGFRRQSEGGGGIGLQVVLTRPRPRLSFARTRQREVHPGDRALSQRLCYGQNGDQFGAAEEKIRRGFP